MPGASGEAIPRSQEPSYTNYAQGYRVPHAPAPGPAFFSPPPFDEQQEHSLAPRL